jgi:RNA polymerase sigma-70 factor (ECF subfamily)
MLRFVDLPMAAPVDPLVSLVRAAASGDSAAVRELIDVVAPHVVTTVERAIGSGNADVEDVAQEALVALLHALPGFRHECTLGHFARRVALRVATAHLRKRRAARRSDGATKLDPDIGETAQSPESSPLAETLSQRRMQLFREVIGDLPPILGETFALKVMLGHSIEEVADATESNINTVRSRLQSAKQMLRDRISADPRFAELREEER